MDSAGGGKGGGAMQTTAAEEVLLVLPYHTGTAGPGAVLLPSGARGSPLGGQLSFATQPKTSSIGISRRFGKQATSSSNVGKSGSTLGTPLSCNCFSNPPVTSVCNPVSPKCSNACLHDRPFRTVLIASDNDSSDNSNVTPPEPESMLLF